MSQTNNNTRRHLLAALLAGDLEPLRAYKIRSQQPDGDVRWIIDGREVGDPIVIVDHQGNKSEITPEEFETLLEHNRQKTWTLKDHSGGRHVPEPDEVTS